MSVINAIILGLIQGVAEFLPISASGHQSIVQNLFGLSAANEGHMLFGFLLHLATLVSVCLVFKQDIVNMYNDCVTLFTTGDARLREKSRLGARQALMLLISSVPMLLVLPFYGKIQLLQEKTIFVGVMMILTGCMLYVADRFLPGKKDAKNITVLDALIIGVSAAVGTLPGMSRIAASVTAGLCCGVDKEYAVKHSFLLSVPALLGGTLIRFVKVFSAGVNWVNLPAYFIGTAVALLCGVLSVGLLQAIAKRGAFGQFRLYCWGAGVITIFLTAIL